MPLTGSDSSIQEPAVLKLIGVNGNDRERHMKSFASLAALFLLSGCAALQSTPPSYDKTQHAFLSPGYPIERVNQPEGFKLVGQDSSDSREGFASASTEGNAHVRREAVAWNTDDDNTALMMVIAGSLGHSARYLEWTDTDGYQFADNQRVQYKFAQGRFEDMVSESSLIPRLAPDCAQRITLSAHNHNKKVTGIYIEGVTCYDLPLINDYHREQLRQKAFRLFGL